MLQVAGTTDDGRGSGRQGRGAQDDNAMKEPSPKSVFRLALIFGIVAATVEMALLLWFMYG
jgi:hypothetical protein